ncbi:MAG TPA: nuclear transport factor 2 family protein [Microlunatus sp.]|nr:nuclear transport factor 2 family protein [Microlunatus sp.]
MTANSSLLERYVALYNAGDLNACIDLYAEEAVQRMPDGIFEGRGAIRDRLAKDLAGFHDATYTVSSFVEQGDYFADEFTFTGTQTGTLELPDGTQLPPTGRRVEIQGMELVQVRDGKIIVDNLYYDNVSALIQLGLAPQLVTA